MISKKVNGELLPFASLGGGEGSGGSSITIIFKPTISGNTFAENGTAQGPTITWGNPDDASYVNITNAIKTEVGDYTLTISIKDMTTTKWSDGTTADVTFSYSIKQPFYKGWLSAADISTSGYSSLSDVLEDEVALRKLFTIHDAVDYIVDSVGTFNTDIETIINNDYCAKWINLRDYALDTLYANSTIAGYMDTADKYFYGEWALMPQVPTMTSDTAPYGEASVSGVYDTTTYAAYKVFDGDATTEWIGSENQASGYIQYHFISPQKITALLIVPTIYNGVGVHDFEILASNDGITFEKIYENTIPNQGSNNEYIEHRYNFQNNSAYTYYRLNVLNSYSTNGFGTPIVRVNTLQFYAWQPKGNVPVMTSNTAPYGEVTCGAGKSDAYKVFDNNPSTTCDLAYGQGGSISYSWFYYKFNNPVCVKRIMTLEENDLVTYKMLTYKISYSNDGSNWTDISGIYDVSTKIKNIVDIDNDVYALYWKIVPLTSKNNYKIKFYEIQFYGREMKVSVPTMTSNTAPYGEVIYGSADSAELHAPYKAFDNDNTTSWTSVGYTLPWYLGYKFTNYVVIKKLCIYDDHTADSPRIRTFKLQGSNDGSSWTDIQDNLSLSGSETTIKCFDINNNTKYMYYRIFIQTTRSGYNPLCATLQFYGFDYSEYDWDTDNSRKYIYDHGVEPNGTISGGTKGEYALTLSAVGTAILTTDTTSYTAMGGKVGMNASGTNALKCGSATSNFTATNMPYGNGIDITSVNGSNAVGIAQTSAGTFDAEEVWIA